MALSKSFPTPKTQELFRVVVNVPKGAPDDALLPATAPIAPEPFVPEVSTPAKLMTVIEETTLWDNVAVTVALLRGAGANVRQISEVPLCAFARRTSTQVSPAPETLLTVVFVPEM